MTEDDLIPRLRRLSGAEESNPIPAGTIGLADATMPCCAARQSGLIFTIRSMASIGSAQL
jgi:hypothetical protein